MASTTLLRDHRLLITKNVLGLAVLTHMTHIQFTLAVLAVITQCFVLFSSRVCEIIALDGAEFYRA